MWPGLASPTELNAAAEGGRSGYTDIGRVAVLVRAGASGTWRITSYGRNRSGNGRGSHIRRVSRRRRRAFKRATGCLAAVPWEPRTGRLRRPRRTD